MPLKRASIAVISQDETLLRSPQPIARALKTPTQADTAVSVAPQAMSAATIEGCQSRVIEEQKELDALIGASRRLIKKCPWP